MQLSDPNLEPLPDALRTATGNFRAWVDFEPGKVREVTADVRLAGVRAQLGGDVLPLDLESLSGRAWYRAQEGGYAAGASDLAFRTRGGLAARGADLSLSVGQEAGQARRGEVRANGVDLKIAAAHLAYLPVPREAKAQAHLYATRGRLLDASLVWTGESPAKASAWRVKGRLEEGQRHDCERGHHRQWLERDHSTSRPRNFAGPMLPLQRKQHRLERRQQRQAERDRRRHGDCDRERIGEIEHDLEDDQQRRDNRTHDQDDEHRRAAARVGGAEISAARAATLAEFQVALIQFTLAAVRAALTKPGDPRGGPRLGQFDCIVRYGIT